MNDRVAVCSENNLEFCIPVCAAFFLGAIVCPMNPLYSERELKHTLSISKPKFIFTSSVAHNSVRRVFRELHWSPKVLMLNEHNSSNVSWMSMGKIISNVSDDDANALEAVSVDVNNHVTVILCSSGTTGLPKGVMLTDKNITTVVRGFLSNNTIRKHISLSLLPFFHSYAFILMVMGLLSGNCGVVLSRFEAEMFLRCIEKYKIQYLPMVPSLMLFLAKHPLVDKYDLSSVIGAW